MQLLLLLPPPDVLACIPIGCRALRKNFTTAAAKSACDTYEKFNLANVCPASKHAPLLVLAFSEPHSAVMNLDIMIRQPSETMVAPVQNSYNGKTISKPVKWHCEGALRYSCKPIMGVFEENACSTCRPSSLEAASVLTMPPERLGPLRGCCAAQHTRCNADSSTRRSP